MNKVVAHFQDGHMVKGTTNDFLPNRETFHVLAADLPAGSKPAEVKMSELKAVFFVRDLAGNPQHPKRNEFEPGRPVPGRKIRVTFKDGEVLVGTTQGYQSGRPGFFVVPADPESNNERCFVVAASTSDVSLI